MRKRTLRRQGSVENIPQNLLDRNRGCERTYGMNFKMSSRKILEAVHVCKSFSVFNQIEINVRFCEAFEKTCKILRSILERPIN